MKIYFAWRLMRRIIRSVKIRLANFTIRAKYVIGFRNPSVLDYKIYPWSNLAAIPGSSDCLNIYDSTNKTDEVIHMAKELSNHRVRIFTEQYLDITTEDLERKKELMKFCEGVDKNFLETYKPIDWHCDFYSGYHWKPDLFFQDIKIAPENGVDIKVPRELSRFQHIGPMLYADRKRYSQEFMVQVSDWIVANPLGYGVNWACAMDVALRAINWIWGLRFCEIELSKYEFLQKRIASSLYDHGCHIYENLEYKDVNIPTGNHYLSEIAGLIYIGSAFPNFPMADQWLLFGIHELVSESERQILPDGMCHEASTSYHRLVAELFVSSAALIERIPLSRRKKLRLIDIRINLKQPLLGASSRQIDLSNDGQILPKIFYGRLELMARFTAAVRKPNGLVFQLGDNDSARVHKLSIESIDHVGNHDHVINTIGMLINSHEHKFHMVKDLESEIVCGGLHVQSEFENRSTYNNDIQLFPYAGIATQRKGRAWLGVSCGTSGQGGRGGHGHNDKNSFELNIDKLDFVVDGGCPAYTYDSNVRNRFRSTGVHSTIYVEGAEQNNWPSGTKGLFMLPEKTSPHLVIENGNVIKGLHNGYGVFHTRRFNLLMNGLHIDDHFEDDRERYIVFNLHPNVTIKSSKLNENFMVFILHHSDGVEMRLDVTGGSSFDMLPGAYSIGYMRPVENKRLRIKINSYELKSVFYW